jgi:MFS family permease
LINADLPRPFWYLMAGTFVNRIGYVVQPFLALYLAGPRAFSATTVGIVLACFGGGALASQVVGGYLADRVGRRVTMVIGLLGTAGCLMVLASVRDLGLIAIGAALSGLMLDVYRPAMSAAIADLVPPAKRPRAYALSHWASNLGVACAGVLGGILADRSYWWLFALDALTCVGFAVIIARAVPETRPDKDTRDQGSYRRVLTDPLAIYLFLAVLLTMLVYTQMFVTLPLAVRASGLSATAYGLIYAVNPVTVIAGQLLVLRLMDRWPPVPMMAGATLLLGAGFGLTGLADSIVTFAGTVVVWSIGEMGFLAVGAAIIAAIAPPDMRGRYNGFFGTSFGGAGLIGPIVGTWLFGVRPDNLWLACFLAGVVASGTIMALGPAIVRRQAVIAAGEPGQHQAVDVRGPAESLTDPIME